MKFAQAERNTLSVRTAVDRNPDGRLTVSHHLNDLELEGPIEDDAYRQWFAAKLQGKSLGAISGVQLEIRTKVLSETVTMTGRDRALREYDGLPEELAARLKHVLLAESEAAGATIDDVARALWGVHMRHVDVPDTWEPG